MMNSRLFVALFVILIGSAGCALSQNKMNADTIDPGSKSSLADESDVGEAAVEDEMETDEFDDFSEFEDEFAALETEVWDPFEGYNRMMTDVNDFLYLNVLDPVSRGYRYVVGEPVRKAIDRFFTNLLYPVRAANNLLQLKLFETGEETLRFAVNSTIGVLGLMDPAKDWFGLDPHDEDFGQTLGHYGVGGGPHLVLPIFGPSNLRDAFSEYGVDYVTLKPQRKLDTIEQKFMVTAIEEVNWTSLHIGEYETLKDNSIEWYIFLRDAYEQKRKKEIEE